jgi:hypothetical protein
MKKIVLSGAFFLEGMYFGVCGFYALRRQGC